MATKSPTFTVKIDCGNAAFGSEGDGNAAYEVSRILDQLRRDIEWAGMTGRQQMTFELRDINGNVVGKAEYK